jgi:DNA-binding NarL/FixJ family response regulator
MFLAQLEKMKKVKVAIVDDHKILRDGLNLMLSEMDTVEIVINASNGQEFIEQLDNVKPDLVIIDINMPVMSGDEAIREAKKIAPNMKIIVLSVNNGEQIFNTMNKIGVDGYIVKESGYEELEHAITTVLRGGKYFSQALLLSMISNRPVSSNIQLTDREQEVLRYICQGLSANEISKKMFISPRTVEKHRSDLLLRTSSPNSISLVVFAIKNRLVKI